MDISAEQLEDLANIIVELIKKDFDSKFLTKNLVNSIKIIKEPNGMIAIEIPAQIYDMKLFFNEGVTLYTGAGSYASSLNEKGSYWGNHKGYIDNAIKQGLTLWMKKNNINGKVSEQK